MTLGNKIFKTIGIMSGTSLDGVDVVSCNFWFDDKWNYKIIKGITYAFSKDIYNKLKRAHTLNGRDLALLNAEYGLYLGGLVKQFLKDNSYSPEFISSHGYTVFHEPQNGFTTQIGSGAHIAAVSGMKTFCDFRSNDVAYGGQGAPLVPIGDVLLFGEYAACLNLGGFANISYENKHAQRIAFDICPVNFVLNYFAEKTGKQYDDGGKIGCEGNFDVELLNALNNIAFYNKAAPKTLGREFVTNEVLPIIPKYIKPENVLATLYEHISFQLCKVVNKLDKGNLLVTGGGANNAYLMQLLKNKAKLNLVYNNTLTEFKEALIFAFLGVLRHLEISNVLSSATGANVDNIGGCEFLP